MKRFMLTCGVMWFCSCSDRDVARIDADLVDGRADVGGSADAAPETVDGSLSPEVRFIGGRTPIACGGVYPQCKGLSAGCRLQDDQYIESQFPGGRKVLVNTPQGDWKIRVLLFLDPESEPRSPGTETDVFWYEPGCADVYHYQLSRDRFAGDLFEKAGSNNVFEVEEGVVENGDHLVEISSDARVRYLLRVEVHPR